MKLYFIDFAQFMHNLKVCVKCNTNFDTYKINHGTALSLQRLYFKKGGLVRGT